MFCSRKHISRHLNNLLALHWCSGEHGWVSALRNITFSTTPTFPRLYSRLSGMVHWGSGEGEKGKKRLEEEERERRGNKASLLRG